MLNLLHPKNACISISFKLSGNFTDSKFSHPLNANNPIFSIPSLTTTLFRTLPLVEFLLSLKACLSIVETLCPSIVLGIVKLLSVPLYAVIIAFPLESRV